jgi:4-hydroxybenzoate polyprenyltransferase
MPPESERTSGHPELKLPRPLVSDFILIQIPMAASAAALLFAISRLLDRPLDVAWYVAAFLGTWCVYLRDSAASCDAEDRISQPRRAAKFRSSRLLRTGLPILSAVLGITVLFWIRPERLTLALLLFVAILGLLHAVPFGGARGAGRTRVDFKRLAVVKSPLVSIAWAGAAVALPLLEGRGESSTANDWIIGMWLAGLLMPLLLADSLLLDIRDLEADRAFNLHTIAVRAGSNRVHLLVGSLIAVSIVVAFLATTQISAPPDWMSVSLTAGIGLGLGWACWPWLRRREAAISMSMMAWRFLLLIPVTLG